MSNAFVKSLDFEKISASLGVVLNSIIVFYCCNHYAAGESKKQDLFGNIFLLHQLHSWELLEKLLGHLKYCCLSWIGIGNMQAVLCHGNLSRAPCILGRRWTSCWSMHLNGHLIQDVLLPVSMAYWHGESHEVSRTICASPDVLASDPTSDPITTLLVQGDHDPCLPLHP